MTESELLGRVITIREDQSMDERGIKQDRPRQGDFGGRAPREERASPGGGGHFREEWQGTRLFIQNLAYEVGRWALASQRV